MKKRILVLGTIVLVSLALLAAGIVLVGNYLKQQAPPTVVSLEFEPVLKDIDAPYHQEEPSFAVAVSAEELAYYKEMLAPADLKGVFKIDFARYFVIVAFQGEKATGGYAIEVRSIVQTGDRVTVIMHVKERQLGKMVDQAVTSPFHVVKVAKMRMPQRGSLTFVFKDTQGKVLAEKVHVVP